MAMNKTVVRDERTVAVENASYAIAYKIAMFALLFDVMYRSFFKHESAWDLLAVVIGGGLIQLVYQTQYKVLTKTWVKVVALTFVIGLLIGFIAAALR